MATYMNTPVFDTLASIPEYEGIKEEIEALEKEEKSHSISIPSESSDASTGNQENDTEETNIVEEEPVEQDEEIDTEEAHMDIQEETSEGYVYGKHVRQDDSSSDRNESIGELRMENEGGAGENSRDDDEEPSPVPQPIPGEEEPAELKEEQEEGHVSVEEEAGTHHDDKHHWKRKWFS